MVKRTVKISSVLIALTMVLFISSHAFGEIKKGEKVTFNFVDIDLPIITKFVSEITKKNFIFDERVKGKITIIAPSKISVTEAFNLFTSVLELKGFTVIPSSVDAYKIVPSSEAKQRGIDISRDKKPVNDSYIARLITLKDISPEDALKFIQPIISKDGYVSAFGPGNLLLVIDSGLNIEKILSTIKIIDRPSLAEAPEIVPLKYATADIVAKIINEGISKRPRGGAVEESKAIADQRLNAVILFGDKGAKAAMKSLISLLDVHSPNSQGMINIYFLEHADATELSKVLDSLIKGTQAQKPSTPAGGAFEAVGGITITADKSSNALLIVASPADYQNLYQIVKQLDKKRRQVFVQAVIAEVNLDKLKELGTQLTVAGGGTTGKLSGAGVFDPFSFLSTTTSPQQSAIVTALTALTGNVKIGANVHALFSSSATNVLSTPTIMTSDNKEAEIFVGENVPFVSSTSVTSITSTQSVERKDTGIILRITPQITEGDYLKLDIYQEISAVKDPLNRGAAADITTTKRSAKTSVVVKDKDTVVIGGLIQDRDTATSNKIPLLGDIPLLGWLFKYTSHRQEKINLLITLTPHIIKESDYLSELSRSKMTDFAVRGKLYASGELIVTFKENVPAVEAQSIIKKQGGTILKTMSGMLYHIRLKKGQDVEDAVEKFSAMPQVKKAEPKYDTNLTGQ
jgi:general secretion pathway protein D